MNSLILLKKDSYEIIQEKHFNKNSKELCSSTIIDLIKDVDLLNMSDFFSIKLQNKLIVYRKSKESKLSIILQTEKSKFKTSGVIDISKVILSILEKKYFSDNLNKNFVIDYNLKDILFGSIEELTVNFLEYLRKNKLFAKFVYFNFNPAVNNAFTYKKIQQDSSSVILFNQNNNNKNENEKLTEIKDTMLQRSTIKEKELYIDLDKKSFQPTERRVFIKKMPNIKNDASFKKKALIKYYSSSFFIEKYVRFCLNINSFFQKIT